MSHLESPEVARLLDRLHGQARSDPLHFLGLLPRLAAGFVRGQGFSQILTPESLEGAFIAVPRREGRFLYLTARAIAARTIVEFGTSFGISAIYLGSAVVDNGGGRVIGSELLASKHAKAVAHLAEAGLSETVEVRLGDALETLKETPEPIDLVFLDGWKDLYLPVLRLLTPRLRPGAVVLADNIHTFRKDLRPYVEYVQSPAGRFDSTTLSISDGVEYSVYRGPSATAAARASTKRT
jgi:predicted O-methyltransferase YrrM